jgi:hypothetical protein
MISQPSRSGLDLEGLDSIESLAAGSTIAKNKIRIIVV